MVLEWSFLVLPSRCPYPSSGKATATHPRAVSAPAEKRAAEDNLPFGDVAGKVGDRMGFVVFGHGQYWDERDAAFGILLATRAFI